jgi:hypothetical protein
MDRFTEEAAEKISGGTSSAITSRARGLPREQAEPKLYTTSDGRPMFPGPNIFSALVAAGVFHKAGRKQITTGKSSLVPAGIQVEELECLLIDPFDPKKPPKWEVDSRSVVIPATGGRVMCHRPRFDAWKIGFTLIVDPKMFDESIVRALVDDMGSKIGIGAYRPARKGPFGRFLVTSWKRDLSVENAPKTKAA